MKTNISMLKFLFLTFGKIFSCNNNLMILPIAPFESVCVTNGTIESIRLYSIVDFIYESMNEEVDAHQ